MLESSLLLIYVHKESGKVIISSIHISKLLYNELLPLMKKYFPKTEESKLDSFYY